MPSGIYTRTDKNNNARGKHWKLSVETRKKMSLSRKGKMPKNISLIAGWNRGKNLTEEHVEKLRLAKLGKLRAGNPENWKHTEETRVKLRQALTKRYEEGAKTWNQGMSGYKIKPCSEERRINISKAKKGKPMPWVVGEKNHNWKGGITPVNTSIRNSTQYADWRTAVFKRDNYTCQECGSKGVSLHADHIKPFAYYPELRLVIDNGRTLCVPCHKLTDTYLWKCAPQVLNKQN